MSDLISVGEIQIQRVLYDTVEKYIVPDSGISSQKFWSECSDIISDLSPLNAALLRKRDAFQAKIDAYHLSHSKKNWDDAEYVSFLKEIGYLVPEGPPFKIVTQDVDREISKIPGPQLVVPGDNARYAINAVNARWGSLLDAFYGTDAGPPESDGATRGSAYNPIRGQFVFDYAHNFLNDIFSLEKHHEQKSSYGDAIGFSLDKQLNLVVRMKNEISVGLKNPKQFAGYQLDGNGNLSSVLLCNNNLHCEIVIDRKSPIGKTHAAGISDILLEAAVTTIVDCEDSVAAVDAAEKAVVYRNWAGLMRGNLVSTFRKGNRNITRRMRPDKTFRSTSGGVLTLPGRSLMLIRNVGLHMYTDAVLLRSKPIPEHILDAMITVFAAFPDLKKTNQLRNSLTGSIYVVKPKMHGPEEVAFVEHLFTRVEKSLGLKSDTIKIGIMDEERRTTVTLSECIRQVQSRLIFINTGFLDRTGDEIHTSMEVGAVLPKGGIKQAIWRNSYEDWNVDIGIEVGMLGEAQIGKGMWAKPDEMKAMLQTKQAHPLSGATTAWVPSPTAATLHAIHYHQINVFEVQQKLAKGGPRAKVTDILQPPILEPNKKLSTHEIAQELENNVQGILGYVSRWIEHGVGCSKVPDINDVGLMEDRATLRIASQHIANWLHHGIITTNQVEKSLRKMAAIVDQQNRNDPAYRPMAPSFTNNAFQCARELIFNGTNAPNGYTEMSLTKYRLAEKKILCKL